MNTPDEGQNYFIIIVTKSQPTTAQQCLRAIGRIAIVLLVGHTPYSTYTFGVNGKTSSHLNFASLVSLLFAYVKQSIASLNFSSFTIAVNEARVRKK